MAEPAHGRLFGCGLLRWLASSHLLQCIVAAVVLESSAAATDCRKVLRVERGADPQELKRAYRREALRWHPDKNNAPEAEDRFREVARCYEELSSGPSRGRHHSPGPGSGVEEYDMSRAFRTFEDLFGDVHRNWRRGMTITGTIVSGGKRVQITIHPDGSTEEKEETAGTGTSYSSVYTSDGSSTSIHIQGDVSELVLDLVRNHVPLPWLFVPLLSAVSLVLCNPFVACAGCLYCCCFQGQQKMRSD